MNKENRERLTGHPSDYGSRTLADEEEQRKSEQGETERTADGDPLVNHGIAGSAISRDAEPAKDENKKT